MGIMIFLVALILIAAVVLTLSETKNPNENYAKKTGKNTRNLTLIYIVFIVLALISLGIYMSMK